VPLWKDADWGRADLPRIGVLMMNVEIGEFAELQSEDANKGFVSALVDQRPDADGRVGTVLEHPQLAKLRKDNVPEKELAFYADLEGFENGWNGHFADPVGAAHADYAGRWLAAIRPVIISEREDAEKTDWYVLVEEQHSEAVEPVTKLKST